MMVSQRVVDFVDQSSEKKGRFRKIYPSVVASRLHGQKKDANISICLLTGLLTSANQYLSISAILCKE